MEFQTSNFILLNTKEDIIDNSFFGNQQGTKYLQQKKQEKNYKTQVRITILGDLSY